MMLRSFSTPSRLVLLARLIAIFVFAGGFTLAASIESSWTSASCSEPLKITCREPQPPAGSPPETTPTVIYLVNLPVPRLGTDQDEAIVNDLLAQGCRVVILDFAHNKQASFPALNRDLAKLRDDIRAGQFPLPVKLDQAHIYIVPSGHRLLRDIVYYREPHRTLALDLIYPSHPAKPTGTVLEFSCDNKDRMGNTSLSICNDTVLDTEATEGFAVAMADHPVAAPYKGIDPMPECAWKIKAAVRALRATAKSLGLGEKIVPVGFSRGSGMALMLVTTAGMKKFEGHGEQLDIDSSVQGGVIMSGRFTYLDLLPGDHMIPRYDKAWGPREKALEVWRENGALDYLETPTLPLFLTINCSEGPDALHQMDILRRRLAEMKSPFTYMLDTEPRGHKVTRDPALLTAVDRYLKERLR